MSTHPTIRSCESRLKLFLPLCILFTVMSLCFIFLFVCIGCPIGRKELGSQWKEIYNVIQTRVTAPDSNAKDPKEDLYIAPSKHCCTCCLKEFQPPPHFPMEEYWSLRDGGNGDEAEKRLAWSRKEQNMCSDCLKLSTRKQAAVRRSRRLTVNSKEGSREPVFDETTFEQRRLKKAVTVRKLGTKFCRDIKQLIPLRHTYYLHALVWHFPIWIATMDVDIMDLSGSGIEMINLETKYIMR